MKVGVVGLGKMGRPIASRLLHHGHTVTVFNRSPGPAEELVGRGALRASTPSDVWRTAEACITMIPDDEALRAVTLDSGGLLVDPPEECVLIDMSTVSVEGSRAIAEAAQAAGVAYLRAPVSGNPSVVEGGNLTIIVSGDEAAFERLRPTLENVGPNIFYLGSGEEARVMKLALNLMLAGTTQLMAEAVVLAEKSGLDRAKLLEVIGGSAIGSPYVKYKTAALVEADYASTFTNSMMYKDLALALEAGELAGVPMPVTALVQQLFLACITSGMADLDLMALVPRLEREAGLEPAVVPH